MMGAMAGAMPNTIMILASIFCAAAPARLSRTMACPITLPAPADAPCMPRKNSSQPKLGANAAPMEPMAKIRSEARITGRRPNESDRVP